VIQPAPAPSRRETLVVLGVLVGLLCVAYGNVVFGGRSLVYTDNFNPLDSRPLAQNYGPGFVPASEWTSRNLIPYANFHDPGATWWQWEPGGEFLRRGLARGELPWWDPYVGAGAPAMANLTQSFFYPPYLLVVALGDTSLLRNAYALSLPLVAALASFLLLRRHGLSREGCAAGAVAMLFCGGIAQNIGSFIGQTAALLPVALLLTRWFLERPSWRRTAMLAGGYAFMALSTFPPLLLAAFGVSAAYAAAVIAFDRDRRRRAVRYVAATALAGGVVAFAYLPGFAVAAATPQAERTYTGAGLETIRWESLSQLASPVLLGGGKVLASSRLVGGPIAVPYVGVVVLLLAGLAAAPPRHDARVLLGVLAVGALVVTLKLIGAQPVQSVGRLPFFDHVHFAHYFGIPLGMLLCLGVAFGVDRLLAGRVPAWRLAVAVGGLVAFALSLPGVAFFRGALGIRGADSWMWRWYVLIAVSTAAVGVVLFCRRGLQGRRRALASIGIVAVLAAEGVSNTYYPRQRRWDVWDHPTPYVRELVAQRGRGRIFSSGTLNANASSAFEVFALDSLMTFNSPRMFELYRRYAAPGAYLFLREADRLPPEGVLDAANIGLVAVREIRGGVVDAATSRRYGQLWSDGDVRILARPTEPRYYFTSQYRVVAPEEALAAVAGPRARREVLVEGPLPFAAASNRPEDPPVATRFTRNRVRLRLRAPRPGLVYCSEADAPGWVATVNGAESPILPANYGFRAVAVPEGDVVVELSYLPPLLRFGLSVSAAALLGAVVLGRRREREPVPPLEEREARPGWPPPRRLVAAACAVLAVLAVGSEVGRRAVLHRREMVLEDPLRARPATFYRVSWGEIELPPSLRAGQKVQARLTVRNEGTETWPDPSLADPIGAGGKGAVRLGYRWWQGDAETVLVDYSDRVEIPYPLPPGESATFSWELQLPPAPGSYRLQVDLVHELVAWFETRGGKRATFPLTVGPP